MVEHTLVKVVAGCVILDDDRVLMGQEKKQKVYGLWNLPAGRVDAGETIFEAARRELMEEVSLEVEIGEQVALYHASVDKPVIHHFYATIVGGELKIDEDELLDAQWLTFDEAAKLQETNKIRSEDAWKTIRKVFNK